MRQVSATSTVHFLGIHMSLCHLLQMLGGVLGAQDLRKPGQGVFFKTKQKEGFLCGA